MRQLERVAGVSLSAVTHHLRAVEMEGKVVAIFDGYYRRYFLSTLVLIGDARQLTEADRRLLAECKRPTSLGIILNLAVDGPLRHKDLELRLGRTKGTISHSLSRLVSLDIVSRSDEPSAQRYVVASPSRVVPLLVTFSGSLRSHVDSYANLWLLLRQKRR
jgi:AcrR family transcriptional regulator